ncbi:MAG: hypothetical protein WCY88_14685 [Spongiibacteraceae bacterium]
MNELQRLSYLEAMGVDNYTPRLRLPGALASQQCVLPVIKLAVDNTVANGTATEGIGLASPAVAMQTDPAVRLAVGSASAASNGAAAAKQALLGAAPAAAAKAIEDLGAKTTLRGGVNKQDIPHFSLSIIRGSNVLILDDGMTGDVDPSEYLQLLTNLLYAVGAGKQQLTIDSFVWPMAKNSHIDQSETAARQALQAFLGNQVERVSSTIVLILGDTPAHYLSEQAIAKGEWVEHPLLPVKLLRSHSVRSMLSDPRIKSVVWQDLQPLYQLFNKR